MLRVVICGGSGYTGSELLRLLATHPELTVTAVTSEKSSGKPVTELFPHLFVYKNLIFETLDKNMLLEKGDIFFTALPHAASQDVADFFYSNGKKVIDLSADYRIKTAETYERWYGVKHNYRKTLSEAVYGLTELYRENVKKASLIANPGCYPTSVILAINPVLKHKLIETDSIIADSKSGVSGAGRKSEVTFSFCEINTGFKAYGITRHRHLPEIEQELSFIAGKPITLTFTPHLLPINRGMLSTVYARLSAPVNEDDLISLYRKVYENDPFIQVLDRGQFPDIKNVRGTNYCQMALAIDRNKTLVVVSVIDNLGKGASGQAVQNLNVMCGFDETTGLKHLPVIP